MFGNVDQSSEGGIVINLAGGWHVGVVSKGDRRVRWQRRKSKKGIR